MRVLMISRDKSGSDPRSTTAARWQLLRNEGMELDVVVASFGSYRQGFRKALRLAKQADLITAQDPFELGFIGWIAARLAKKPFEIQDHGGFFDGERPDEPLWRLRRLLAHFLAHRADAVRTVSPASEKNLHTAIGDRVYWLPIAAEEKFLHLERRPEPGLIVTVSRLIPVKRVDLLLKTFAVTSDSRQDAKLVIVGDGPERPRLERLAATLGIRDRVTFAGARDPAPWLERASLFVSLSRHEGWGIASVEAAMAGVPVLMTDTGCARWLERHGRATVIRHAEETAAKTVELLALPPVSRQPLPLPSPSQTAETQVKRWQTIARRRPPAEFHEDRTAASRIEDFAVKR